MIIVFEGIDGSGKGTQSKNLSEYLTNKGVNNALFSFPNYTGTFFGSEIAKYLNGSYGSMEALPAEFPAMLYALDRFEMKNSIIEAAKSGKTIILDRYVSSNFAHQAAKLPRDKQDAFIEWVKNVEYNILGLPMPHVVFFLDVPPRVTRSLVLKKDVRSYTKEKEDIHEKNSDYLQKVYNVYKHIAAKDGWNIIPCMDKDRLRSQEEIFTSIVSFLASV